MKTHFLAVIAYLVAALALLTACGQRDKTDKTAQIIADVLNPEGRVREVEIVKTATEVAKTATEVAKTATEVATEASKMAQANIEAANKATADTIEAKAQAAKAAASLKAIEASLPPASPAPTPK